MLHSIIVGQGLSGIAMAETLEKAGKSFVVFDDVSSKASQVAGGLYNPVILKRFTPVWKAQEQLALAKPFYGELQHKLGVVFDHPLPVWRRFASVEEQNLWFQAADKPLLGDFLDTDIQHQALNGIDAPYGFGLVRQTGRLDTHRLLEAYRQYLEGQGRLWKERLHYEALEVSGEGVSYKGLKAQNLIVADGFGLRNNPFFDYLPLTGTKGELLTIKAEDLTLDVVLKSAVFIIPLGGGLFSVGATYKWKDKTDIPTPEARVELLQKLETFLKCPFEVVGQVAGIRPTVVDRRPLVGQHPQYPRVWVLNGMGSRGVMTAPYAAQQLWAYMEKGQPLDPAMDIKRFEVKYNKA